MFCAEGSWQKFILGRYYIQIQYSKLISEPVFLILLSLPYMHACENLSCIPPSRPGKRYADDKDFKTFHSYVPKFPHKEKEIDPLIPE